MIQLIPASVAVQGICQSDILKKKRISGKTNPKANPHERPLYQDARDTGMRYVMGN